MAQRRDLHRLDRWGRVMMLPALFQCGLLLRPLWFMLRAMFGGTSSPLSNERLRGNAVAILAVALNCAVSLAMTAWIPRPADPPATNEAALDMSPGVPANLRLGPAQHDWVARGFAGKSQPPRPQFCFKTHIGTAL